MVEVRKDRVLISQFLDTVKTYLSTEGQEIVYQSYLLAAEAHEGQKRKDGSAYIYHPISVALILASMKMDSATLSAAILHDVIEDTEVTREQLVRGFGEEIAHLVDGVSKITQITSNTNDKAHAEAATFRKMLLAMAKDVRVMMIKLADRLHNMHTLEHLKPEQRQRIAHQTLEIYAPIANRLGMREIHAELEDLCFRTLHPVRYKAIADKLAQDTRGRKPAEELICATLKKRFAELGITHARIVGRQKRVYSIYQKMRYRKVTMRGQRDIHGIRIIVHSRDECYRALGIVHEAYTPILHALKDYIGLPKINGYQSLHTVVIGPHGKPVEVQIRTVTMDRVAETGVASHWIYKHDEQSGKPPQQIVNKWLEGFLDSQEPVGDSAHFMEHLRAEMFPDKLFVFTPKGDIKRLPVGATVVDFAYAVHSDVGNACVGAKVNDEPVPLHTVLESGDSVDIVTGMSGHPRPTWLNYVVTAKARTAVRQYLSHQQDKQALALGRRLLTVALRDSGFEGSYISSQHKVDLLKVFDLKDWNQLLLDIGFGRRLPLMVAQQLISMTQLNVKEVDESNQSGLAIRGSEHLLVNYASCCYPLPDDRIIGVFAPDRGLVVHQAECNNTKKYHKLRDQWQHLIWSKVPGQKFSTRLLLEVKHQPGALAKVSQIIAEQSSNILKVNVSETDPNFANVDLVIEVDDRAQASDIVSILNTEAMILKIHQNHG